MLHDSNPALQLVLLYGNLMQMHAVHTVFFDHCVREYPNAPHAFSIEVNAIFTDQNVNT